MLLWGTKARRRGSRAACLLLLMLGPRLPARLMPPGAPSRSHAPESRVSDPAVPGTVGCGGGDGTGL